MKIENLKAFEDLKKFLATGDYRYIREPRKAEELPGRNDGCPCGSGKKFKKCCMK
jgi:uncharacterized protein YecA (UPF0149 family)